MNNLIRGRSSWMWRSSQRWLLFLLAIAMGMSGSATQAQGKAPSSEYQQLIDRGLAAYQAQHPAEARSLFAQAHALQPGARTLRALGIADLALDNYTMAKDELEASLGERTLPLSESQRAEVRDLLRWMQSNLGTLHLSYTPLHAEAKIDGRTVKQPELLLAPEEHRLTISAQGFVPHERTFTVTIDRPMQLSVSLERAPMASEGLSMAPSQVAEQATAHSEVRSVGAKSSPAQQDDSKLWPWIGGAGAVLLAAGGTMFAFGMSDKATVENARSSVRLSEIEAAHDRVPWLTGIGFSLGAVGLLGVGTAAILLLTGREPHADEALTMVVGPGNISITRRF